MEMNVDLDNLRRLFETGLAPEIERGGAHHDLRVRLTHEILVYGATVLPKAIFQKTSGKEIAAMVCEDIEGALRLLPLLEPRVVHPPTPTAEEASESETGERAEDDEADGAVAPVPEPKLVRPRVVHVGEGWGVPSVVLAALRPEQPIEIVDEDPRRDWFWRRLKSVFSLRNLSIRIVADVDAWAAEQRESIDLLLLKNQEPEAALEFALPLLRPGGRLASWQRQDRAQDVRRPIVDPRGQRIELDESHAFVSTVARPRTLLCVRCAEVGESSPAGI